MNKTKTFRLVIGIVSMVLFFVVMLQSCAVSVGDALTENSESGGAYGLIVAVFMLIAGIVSIAARRSRGACIFCLVLYALAGLIGTTMKGTYSDLGIWGALCLIFAFVFFLGLILNSDRYAENPKRKRVAIIAASAVLLILLFVPSGGNSNAPETDNAKSDTASAVTSDATPDSDPESEPESIPESAVRDIFCVGDVIETDDFRISYLDCGEYESDNMFIQPADGNRFIMCEFEFENISDTDQYVSSLSFDCYADGQSCDICYLSDNDLSATLSAGRKVTGAVCFEVPGDAQTIEVEYLANAWNSERIVFSYTD